MDYRNLILEGNVIGLDELRKGGWDLNERNNDELGYTPLIEAIRSRKDSMEVIEYLVEQGADLEKGDSREGTPLLHACICADNEVLLFLIAKGANVNCQDNEGFTPLHYICRYADQWNSQSITPLVNTVTGEKEKSRFEHHIDILKILLANKADVNKLANNGFTPLHLAASNNGQLMIPLLVEAGADVNFANANQYTPLHSAADSGNRTVVNWLKSYGADRTAQVQSAYNIVAVGDTALDVARKMNRQDLVDALTDIQISGLNKEDGHERNHYIYERIYRERI